MIRRKQNGASHNVTGDKTWFYYYDVSTKAQNKVWLFEDEKTPVTVRKSRSVKKRLIAVIFTMCGIVTCVVLENHHTMTTKCYSENFLPQVIQALGQLRQVCS